MVSRPQYVVTTAFGTAALVILWFEVFWRYCFGQRLAPAEFCDHTRRASPPPRADVARGLAAVALTAPTKARVQCTVRGGVVVCKLPDCGGDPKPSCRPGSVTIRREFMRALGAFQHRFIAVPCNHEVGDAPNVDFRDHDGRLSGDLISTVNVPVPAFSPVFDRRECKLGTHGRSAAVIS